MSKAAYSKGARKGVSVDGMWLPISCDFLAGRACAQLSPLACKMLLTLMGQLKTGGFGNGRLDAHPDRLAAAGWTSTASARAALHELIDSNLVVCTRQGAKGRIGLYGITLFPMECKRDDLEVGPGAWQVSEWRLLPDVEAAPTKLKPAIWHRPRKGEKRTCAPRSGNESSPSIPAEGVQKGQVRPWIPATGPDTKDLAGIEFPQRDSPSREPSAGGIYCPLPADRRQGRLLARRTAPGLQPGYAAARERLSLLRRELTCSDSRL